MTSDTAIDIDVVVDGIRLHCRVDGRPGSPPMVLLHALGEDGSDWDDVVAELDGDFQTYAVDLRGHGTSDWPGYYSFELMRDDVLGLLDQLGLDAVTLVGHSLGGLVAYLVAESQPARITRLVVADVCPPYPRERPIPERPDHPVPFDWPVVPAIATETGIERAEWWDALADITAPTLLVGGGPTSHVPQDLLAAVARRVPDCRLVTIEAGHHVHREAPESFMAALSDFLADTTA